MKSPRTAAAAILFGAALGAAACPQGTHNTMAGMNMAENCVADPQTPTPTKTAGQFGILSATENQPVVTQPTTPRTGPQTSVPGNKGGSAGGLTWDDFRGQLKNPNGGGLNEEKEVIDKFVQDAQNPPPGSGLRPIKPGDVNVADLNQYLGDEDAVIDAFGKAFPGRHNGETARSEVHAMFVENMQNPDNFRQALDHWLQDKHGTDLNRIMKDPQFSGVAQSMQKISGDMVTLMSEKNKSWSGTLMAADELSKAFMPDKQREEHDDNGKNSAPNSPAPYIDAAKDELASGNTNAALSDLNHAISLDPGNSNALTLRSEGEFMQHDLAGAGRDAKAALAIDPDNDKAARLLALSAGHDAMPSSTLSAAGGMGAGGSGDTTGGSGGASGAALRGTAPSGSAAAVGDAQTAMKLGDYGLAVGRLTQAISLNGDNAAAYNLRAIAYNRMGQYEASLRDAIEGLKRAPKNAQLLLTKAVALNKLHRYAEAEAAARDAIAADPKNGRAYEVLAEALAGQRRNREAIDALRAAAALDPRFNAKLQSALQLPSESDLMFLFPDNDAQAAKKAPVREETGGKFSKIIVGSLMAGLLLGLGLLKFLAGRGRPAEAPVTAPSLLTRRESAPGLLRGRYQLGPQIGVGGMGLVYEGQDLNLKRRVAIKKMRDEIRLERRERERFVGEAKVVAGLHHPGIVDVFAILEEHDDVYLVFEFVTGKTLHDVVQSAGALSLAKAVPIIKAAGEALDYAHSRNVIHRDLKPSNIMVTEEGKIKVMDFGIARVAKDAMSHYSMTNTVVGTPPYMAPEQEQGVVRRESDVYALGVCLYEMLTGKMPFNGSGSGMLMNKINKSYVPASKAMPGLPTAVDGVFARALDPDPEKRFHSAQELVAALEALAQASRG